MSRRTPRAGSAAAGARRRGRASAGSSPIGRRAGRAASGYTRPQMGAWYWIGVFAGIGVALGILVAGIVPAGGGGRRRRRRSAAPRSRSACTAGSRRSAVASAASPAASAPLRSPPARSGAAAPGSGSAALMALAAIAAAGARVRAGPRLPRGDRACPRSRSACAARRPSATPVCARSRATDATQAGRPDHHRRAHAVDARGDRRARAPVPARARQLPPRRLDLPVADAGLPRLDRDRRPRRRARHPAPRLVEPRRGAPRRVRLVVRRPSRLRARPGRARHGRQPERAPSAEERRDGLRGARGRGPHDRGDQHHDLPRPQPPPLADPGLPAGARAEAVLLLQRLRVRQDRRPDRVPQPLARVDRRLRGDDRPLARHARRLRPARPLPARLRLRLARARPRCRARGARAGRTPRSAALFEAAGGADAFLERYGVVLCSDHGQSPVEQAARLDVPGALVTASNRAAMLYGDDPRRLAEALDGEPSVDVAALPRGRGGRRPQRTATRTSRCSTTTRTAAPAPRARCGTRTPARCSSRRRRAGSSSTWPAATTSAAAATARSRPATPRCRC